MKSKPLVVSILAVIGVIILLQNTRIVSFHILFWKVTMSGIIFFVILLTIGFIVGYWSGRKR
ncbi:MAG: DUF1049 domain-containing protein [Candidatus Omnitrophica bacterium]|nr:DUF1049 domain-containing protein [Candidatus Omnitrophota bacterium]